MKNPSACEADITGLIGLDVRWPRTGPAFAGLNNNYGYDSDQAFSTQHLPQDVFGREALIARRLSPEPSARRILRCQGGLPARFTYRRATTDDTSGQIQPIPAREDLPVILQTFGGYGIKLPCKGCCGTSVKNGFEHHVAICPGEVGAVIMRPLVNT